MVAIIWKPGSNLILAYFKRKDCIQRTSIYTVYHYEKALKASDIVWSVSISAVIWSRVLISVTWVELLWAVYKFFRINNIDLKCSFVGCRKYHKSWWNGAAELHISVDLLWHNGRRATQLCRFTLWHNRRRNFWKMIVLKDSANTDR